MTETEKTQLSFLAQSLVALGDRGKWVDVCAEVQAWNGKFSEDLLDALTLVVREVPLRFTIDEMKFIAERFFEPIDRSASKREVELRKQVGRAISWAVELALGARARRWKAR